ncbi:monooxygenase [Bacillus sp. FJAT-50079]|uniref:monooxygenase n=1 Tax=Bacillus sp. FJAT-50079 TaxID=2833577 RepID=UPI001BC98CB6|nr:monooxygenase [Bacillus sp. FJAT-50079]MBS4210052.1 monooxygenase [Bacillus sp. FJAT-50079]
MAYILQVDFTHTGPFGEEMATAFANLARSINEEKGFMWKIWTENKETNQAGGIYVFETKEDAEGYLDMHLKRLSGFGIENANAKVFGINEGLSQITHSPIK